MRLKNLLLGLNCTINYVKSLRLEVFLDYFKSEQL